MNVQENWSLEVLIAPDESFLLLAAGGRKDGYGGPNIYVSEQKDGAWSEPRNLGPKVNTAARDYSPGFTRWTLSVLVERRSEDFAERTSRRSLSSTATLSGTRGHA